MAVRIGINGFGRIGRCVVRAGKRRRQGGLQNRRHQRSDGHPTLAHLLKYDSVHGRFDGNVTVDGNNIVVDGKPIVVTAERISPSSTGASTVEDRPPSVLASLPTHQKRAPHRRRRRQKC